MVLMKTDKMIPRTRHYLLFKATLLLPLFPPPDLLEPLENNLVMNSETSGNSGLGFNIFIDCSISCRKKKQIKL